MLINYLKITWKVLKRKKVYTLVTLAGIIIPVTFIVLITSFLVHLNNNNAPKSRFEKVFYIDTVNSEKLDENGKRIRSNGNPPTYAFINNYIKTLKSPALVSAVSDRQGNQGIEVIYQNNKAKEVSVKQTDSEFWQITDFEFIHGRPFNKAEFEQGARIIVIDQSTSELLFGTSDAVGNYFEIKNKSYRVCGIVENVDITMHRIAANIYMPYSCLDNYMSYSTYSNWSHALILAEDPGDISKIEEELQQKIKTFDFSKVINFNHIRASIKRETYLDRIGQFASMMFRFYGNIERMVMIAGLLLFFSLIILPAVNLVNINTNRVFERLSEIGVRKTFGATTGVLIGQFLFENVVIIFMGGILSIMLSFSIIYFINQADALGGIYLSINFTAVMISLMAIFILSILSGLLPSITMARSNIIQSLNSSESK